MCRDRPAGADRHRRCAPRRLALIAATADAAAAFKPNAAFFEALGHRGFEVLIEIVAAVPEEIPVILDAKRGDIASSATGYATAAFDVIGAGAVTVNPYLGRDAIDPFLAHENRAVWVLCRHLQPVGGRTAGDDADERAESWQKRWHDAPPGGQDPTASGWW